MYNVLYILKDKKGKTIGARVTDGVHQYDLEKKDLVGMQFVNVVVTKDGFVRSKSGVQELPVMTINTENVVTLYHGSTQCIKGRINLHSNIGACDFGAGFYLGENKMQAMDRVCNYASSKLYTFELNLNGLNVYDFTDDTLWALFVGYNRSLFRNRGIQVPRYLSEYFNRVNKTSDVIKGYIADDKIADSFANFIQGGCTDIALSKCLKLVKYGKQYAIKTDSAVGHLKKVRTESMDIHKRNKVKLWGYQQRNEINAGVKRIQWDYMDTGERIKNTLARYENLARRGLLC